MDRPTRAEGLLAWQWTVYRDAHRNPRNLMVHALTAPLFLGGTVALLVAPLAGIAAATFGIAAMVLSIALQGRGHRREQTPPQLFRGPADAIARIFAEQWITFPRFVASGAFAAALRAARRDARRAGG